MQGFIEIPLPAKCKTRNRLVSGIGINDAWYITERKDSQGNRLKCPYSVKWKSILTQVSKLSTIHSTNVENYICKDWLCFSNFRRWMETQQWINNELYCQDKYYSPETCKFVPSRKDNLIYGVGVYETGKYKGYDSLCGSKNGMTKEYSLWVGMLQRCYSDYQKDGRNSTYAECTVSDNFKNFQYFAEWCNSQIGFNCKDYHLDKDLLIKGNKVYSEDTCVFVPKELNMLFNKKKKQRGSYPIGVSFHKRDRHYAATVSVGKGRCKLIGQFDSPDEAYIAYKLEKERIVKAAAEYWKEHIDIRVYVALMNYEVEITD